MTMTEGQQVGRQQSPLGIRLPHGDQLHCSRGIEKWPCGGGRWGSPLHMAPLEQLGWGLPEVAYLLFYCLQCTQAGQPSQSHDCNDHECESLSMLVVSCNILCSASCAASLMQHAYAEHHALPTADAAKTSDALTVLWQHQQ